MRSSISSPPASPRRPSNEPASAIRNCGSPIAATAVPPVKQRAYAKFQGPGVYATTVTQPAFFRTYLLEQLNYLVRDYGATIEVGVSDQEIPYPYVFERGDELGRGAHSAAELAQHFPTPLLAKVGDEIADGTWVFHEDEPRPLSLFDAARVDYSLRRLVHYTGTDWRCDPALDPAHQLPPLCGPVRPLGGDGTGERGRALSAGSSCPAGSPSSAAWTRPSSKI